MIPRALITGISGSGGSYLAEHIARTRGWEIHGFSRWHGNSRTHLPAGIATVHEVDLNDASSVMRGFLAAKPSIVFHLASHANVRAGFDTPIAVLQNNIIGTANLLETMRLINSTATLVVASTSEVYGQVHASETPITEAQPYRPASPYAVSKLAQDLLSQTYWASYKLQVVRTRMFSYFNARRADLFSTAFARQIVAIERGHQSELLHGNLDSIRVLVDVRDTMEAYCLAAEKGAPGEAYNIGGDTPRTVGDVLRALKERARAPIPSRPDPKLIRPADVTLQIPDSTKFRERTGWRPSVSFEESVAQLLAELRTR